MKNGILTSQNSIEFNHCFFTIAGMKPIMSSADLFLSNN